MEEVSSSRNTHPLDELLVLLVDLDIGREEEEQVFVLLHVTVHAAEKHGAVYYFEADDFVLRVDLLKDHFEFVTDSFNSIGFKVKVGIWFLRIKFDL